MAGGAKINVRTQVKTSMRPFIAGGTRTIANANIGINDVYGPTAALSIGGEGRFKGALRMSVNVVGAIAAPETVTVKFTLRFFDPSFDFSLEFTFDSTQSNTLVEFDTHDMQSLDSDGLIGYDLAAKSDQAVAGPNSLVIEGLFLSSDMATEF